MLSILLLVQFISWFPWQFFTIFNETADLSSDLESDVSPLGRKSAGDCNIHFSSSFLEKFPMQNDRGRKRIYKKIGEVVKLIVELKAIRGCPPKQNCADVQLFFDTILIFY